MLLLDNNKGLGRDDVSFRMRQICGQLIIKPLYVKFQSSIDAGTFPGTWEISNIVTVHKRRDNQIVGNYPSITHSQKNI